MDIVDCVSSNNNGRFASNMAYRKQNSLNNDL